MLKKEEKIVNIGDGISLEVLISSPENSIPKATVLLLLGLRTDIDQYFSISDPLGEIFEVYSLNYRGKGKSNGLYEQVGSARDAAKFIRKIEKKVHVIGHSSGCMTGGRLIAENPELVSSFYMLHPYFSEDHLAPEYKNPMQALHYLKNNNKAVLSILDFLVKKFKPEKTGACHHLLRTIAESKEDDFRYFSKAFNDANKPTVITISDADERFDCSDRKVNKFVKDYLSPDVILKPHLVAGYNHNLNYGEQELPILADKDLQAEALIDDIKNHILENKP